MIPGTPEGFFQTIFDLALHSTMLVRVGQRKAL